MCIRILFLFFAYVIVLIIKLLIKKIDGVFQMNAKVKTIPKGKLIASVVVDVC